MRSHEDLDARSLAMHRLVVQKLQADPSLLNKVARTLVRWRESVSPSTQPYLEQWQRALDGGLQSCSELALEESENADTLRQCSPFAGLLDNEERFRFLRDWKRQHDA